MRYDPHEKTHGQPLPHLFARRGGTRHEVTSLFAVRTLLNATADWAGLTDNGSPCGSPHTTSAACSSLLGHLSLDTTRGYTAVFPEHLTGYALRWALQLAFLRAQQSPTPPQRGSAAPGSSPGRLRDPT